MMERVAKTFIPASIYLHKVNNRNTRKRCEICSKLTIKTPERRHWLRFDYVLTMFWLWLYPRDYVLLTLAIYDMVTKNFRTRIIIFVVKWRRHKSSTVFTLHELSWRRLLYRNQQSIDLQSKPMDWFLYDNGLRHEWVKKCKQVIYLYPKKWKVPSYIESVFADWLIFQISF